LSPCSPAPPGLGHAPDEHGDGEDDQDHDQRDGDPGSPCQCHFHSEVTVGDQAVAAINDALGAEVFEGGLRLGRLTASAKCP
jgi:hypothetical protein